MNSVLASLHKVLKDKTRRRIILLLQEKGSHGYVDLMKALGIANTGKMNYHLKVLGDLLSKNEDGRYSLSEKGELASRLLLELPKLSSSQLGLGFREPQVFWWGIIVCIFTMIGLSVLLRYVFSELTSGYLTFHSLGQAVPLFYVGATFLIIGSYMIISDVRKNSKPSPNLGGLTKRKVIVLAILIMVGLALIGVADSTITSDETLTQIDHMSNTAGLKSYLIFLQQGVVCRIALTVSTTEIGQSYNVSVNHIEENRSLYRSGGPIDSQVIWQGFRAYSTGHYEVYWNGLNVTQVTAYRLDTVTPLILKYAFSAAGVFVLIAGAVSFLGFERDELFHGRKTGVFWWGLVVFGLALSWLFTILWRGLVLELESYGVLESQNVLFSLAIPILLFIGFHMMKEGAKRESQAYGPITESKLYRLHFYLSQRNYRALVYLLASVVIHLFQLIFRSINFGVLYLYINPIGIMLLLLFYGPPRPYGGWVDPNSILPFLLLTFSLFVEIFIACEFFISVNDRLPRVKKPEDPQPPLE